MFLISKFILKFFEIKFINILFLMLCDWLAFGKIGEKFYKKEVKK